MILRHLELPATANDFATCHVTLFGWRNGGRARTLHKVECTYVDYYGSVDDTTWYKTVSEILAPLQEVVDTVQVIIS